jgi:phosphoglycolate phosphatase
MSGGGKRPGPAEEIHTVVRLIVFDCDGTLVDSQAGIVASVRAAFLGEGLTPPPMAAIRRVVGLSLHEAMLDLLAEPEPAIAARLVDGYKAASVERRGRPEFHEPLFPGARELLDALLERDLLLGIATGKAMRGLRFVLDRHGLAGHFTTLQTADLHPSKPHPAMLRAAMAETGAAPGETMLVGDTTFDVLMARAAGAMPVGVAWGNHPADELTAAGAACVLDRFEDLARLLPKPRGSLAK